MAKISALDPATPLTGAETIPVVQDAETRGAAMSEIAAAARAPIAAELDAGASAYGAWLQLPGNAGKTVEQFLETLRSQIPGPAGNVALTIDALKAAPIANDTMLFQQVGFRFLTDRDYAGFWDDIDFVKSDHHPSGAWVRPSADKLTFRQVGDLARLRPLGEKAGETVTVTDFEVDPTGASDSAAGIQNALDLGGVVRVPPGQYQLAAPVTLSVPGTRLEFDGGASLTYTDPELSAIVLSAPDCRVSGATIDAPAVFDATNAPPTYAVIEVRADNCSISDTSINNVPRVGIWFKDCNNGRVVNCHIDGGTVEGFFNGANTFHYGVFIDPAGTGSQGNFILGNNIIRRCVQGAGTGNFGAASAEQSVTVTGNVFELCWNHGYYSPGLARGITVSGNAFNACQVPIALTGWNHVVDGNTLIVQTAGGGTPTDNEVTGISLRDPYGCVVTNNSIKGEGAADSACISLEEHALVPGINSVENNIVSGNVIEITNPLVASVAAIRFMAIGGKVRNNIASDNTIRAPIRENFGLISVIAGAAAPADGNSVTGNTIVITGSAGTGYGVYLSNVTDSDVTGNKVLLAYDAAAPVSLSAIAANACQRIVIGFNIVRCSAEWGANVTFRGVQETTSGSGSEVILNRVNFDPAKLAGSQPFVLLPTSGVRVEHAGAGSPEGAVISGIGGLWRRTDGAAGTTLYVKESGTSNTGWVPARTGAPQAILNSSTVYDPPSLADGQGVTTTVAVVGAALGDFASASFSIDTGGVSIGAWVSAPDTVSIRFQNETGSTVDIGVGTLRARVLK